jgi:predicted transcriptional regulator of viral defense system
MRYIELKEQLKNFIIFSLKDIKKKESGFDRRRLSEWQTKGYIKKIRRGFYVFSDQEINEKTLFLIANKIYKPSYVSCEMALSFYNLIPEGVYLITSISTKKTMSFNSPAGNFNYHKIKPELFFGYHLIKYHNQSYKIAEIEKAVLDYLYLNPSMSDTEAFLEWRFNREEFLAGADMEKFQKYLALFKSKSLKQRVKIFLKFIGENHAES